MVAYSGIAFGIDLQSDIMEHNPQAMAALRPIQGHATTSNP